MVSAGGLYTYSHLIHPHEKKSGKHDTLQELLPGATPAGAIRDGTPTTGMSEIPETSDAAVKQRKFSEAIQRRDPAGIPAKTTQPKAPVPESYRQKLAAEELAQETRSQERSGV